MQLTPHTTYQLIERLAESYGHYWDTAEEYGEPGYSTSLTGDTPIIVLGSYWCRCDKFDKLHGIEDHHPRLWAQLEDQGVEFEWDDEWYIDHDHSKAYRTSPDSYLWQTSIVYNEYGDVLTPDDDHADIIEWATDDTSRAIPRTLMTAKDLTAAGWTCHTDRLENGWHTGMVDTPEKVADIIRGELGDDTPIVFSLDAASQFYVTFSAWTPTTHYYHDTDTGMEYWHDGSETRSQCHDGVGLVTTITQDRDDFLAEFPNSDAVAS